MVQKIEKPHILERKSKHSSTLCPADTTFPVTHDLPTQTLEFIFDVALDMQLLPEDDRAAQIDK